ncbi:MAG: TetR/AcrR family transcriptional regulator [Spirochaetes bacterium]|nr:TetR/AcrR family transcriptional regulator [Spirochaetota bacterium]
MARNRDENKRKAILQTSKLLFAQKGFFGTAISDIVRETGMTVGTIYTYFSSKDEIVHAIVEEGWSELYSRLERDLGAAVSPEDKLRLLIERFIPEVVKDVDLISILLSEAVTYTRLEEKIERITDLVFSLTRSLAAGNRPLEAFTRQTLRTAIVVIFLGIMSTVRIARASSLGISNRDIVSVVKVLARESLRIDL